MLNTVTKREEERNQQEKKTATATSNVLHTQVAKLSSNKKEAAKQMLAQYDAVLLFLKSHGALLNAVKAEMLLEEDDFVRYA